MSRPLNILIVADSKIPIPPRGYGGVERVVALLAEGLAAHGHSVRLLGHPQSSIPGEVIGYPFAGRRPRLLRGAIRIMFTLLFERELRRRPDVVIATCRIDYLSQMKLYAIPLVYGFHNPISVTEVDKLRALGNGGLQIIALTRSHADVHINAADLRIIGNCVDLDRLSYSPTSGEGYIAFLGRLTRNKGPDTAIRIARRTGLPLRLAGNISDEDGGREFFETEVRPQLDDQIRWIGEITDAEKSAFLSNARALLVPNRWEEPFGIVVPEALACGTPVIACPHGSMPELILPGKNGFLASSEEEFVLALEKISTIDRGSCRADAEARFSPRTMTEHYLEAIRAAIDAGAAAGGKAIA